MDCGLLALLVLSAGLPDWVPFAAFVVAVVALWLIVEAIRNRKRKAELTAVAQQIGFYFQGEDWNGPQQAPSLRAALFTQGRNGKFRNIMTGGAGGFRVALFDYLYTVGYGRSQRTYKQTVAAFSKNGTALAQFAIRPKGIWQKIGNAIVHKDINFDTHAEFSRAYQLRGPDELQVRALFTPQLLSFLETLDRKRTWQLEGEGDTLMMYRRGKRVKPADVRTYLEETSAIAASFISYGGVKSAS